MPSISPAQMRAARAMLDWSIADLAEVARVSVSTVKRFEGEKAQPVSAETVATMRDALEMGGVLFLTDDGSGAELRMREREGHS